MFVGGNGGNVIQIRSSSIGIVIIITDRFFYFHFYTQLLSQACLRINIIWRKRGINPQFTTTSGRGITNKYCRPGLFCEETLGIIGLIP